MCDAGVMAKHNPVPLGRWLRPRVEDERRTVPTSREEREGSFPFWYGFVPTQNVSRLEAAGGARSLLLEYVVHEG